MKRTRRLGLLVVGLAHVLTASPIAAADPLPRARPDALGLSSARLGRIGQVLERDVGSGRMPGAVVAIARRGKLVYYEAFGFLDKAAGVRMPKDAIFSLASMTKPMTGVATLLLQEEGHLHLAEPAAKYLPALGKMRVGVASSGADAQAASAPKTVPLRVPISIQDLMAHTAGMAYGFSGKSPLNKLWPNTAGDFARTLDSKAFIESIAALPLLHQPGSVWEYSVSNDVLGVLVEAVAGKPLGKYLDQRVFAPLGMRDTGFVIPADKVKRHARALPKDPETGANQVLMDATTPPRFDCGGACAVSTAADYLRFAQMLLDRGRFGNVRILGRKSVELMTNDHLGTDIRNTAVEADPTRRGVGYGLTVSVRTDPGVSPYLGSRGEFGWGGAY
ncbi:MAG TPA: serine hydrolase domain-containing protein, partial [Polyangia bacterium]